MWALIQAYIDNERYRPSERQVAAELGVTGQTLGKWKRLAGLPARDRLVAISELTGVPYEDVLHAALIDIGYIDHEESDRGDATPMNQARDDTGLTAETWDRRAAPLRAAGFTDRAIVDTLGGRPSEGRAGEVDRGPGHNVAGHGPVDRRQRRTS